MRATEYLFLVVVIGIFAIIVTMGATEFNQIYTSKQIDTSNMEQYKDFSKVSDIANSTFQNFQKLSDDSKWYQKIGAGIVAIPYAVISFPIMIAVAITTLTKYMGSALGGIVPQPIILALLALLLIEVVRRLMEFFNRARA